MKNISALNQRLGILKDHEESIAAKFICNQLDYFMVTDKILEEDTEAVSSVLGTKTFEYPMFYDGRTLQLLEETTNLNFPNVLSMEEVV